MICTNAPMTVEEIERTAERAMDRLDRQLMRGELTQEQYHREIGIVDSWTIEQYKWAVQTTA
jgi:uncharacterized membrane protein